MSLDPNNPNEFGTVEAFTRPAERSVATVLESRSSRLASVIGRSKVFQQALGKIISALDHYAIRNSIRAEDVVIDRVESHTGVGGFRIVIFVDRNTRLR